MSMTSIRSENPHQLARRIDWGAAWAWLLGFGLIAYLGLKGGGFDPLLHDQVGIAIWWVVLAATAVGALPRLRPGPLGWAALGLLAGFTVWTALSLSWTESTEKTATELALVATYLGVFLLAVFSRGAGRPERLADAVAAGLVLVAVVGLLSRLHPAWFPEAGQTGRFLEDSERLAYPVNYWNGLGALVAIGLPLLLQIATGARSILFRALAAAALPAMVLTIFLTLSRGGMAAAVVALAVYLAMARDRLPKLMTLLVAGAGSAFLIALTLSRDALREGLINSTAHQQGDDMLLITIVVCLLVGLAQAAISYALVREMRPGWTFLSRRASLIAVAVAAVLAIGAMAAADVPGRVSNGWDEFREGGKPGEGTGRLGSVAGQSRYQFWSSAGREFRSEPLTGTGAGTFEFWWTRDGDSDETVRNAHSLYMQTLGELGAVGIALLAGFFLCLFLGGGRAALRAGPGRRDLLAASLAGCVAFSVSAIYDWTWQIPVLPVALLLLGSLLVGPGPPEDEPGSGPQSFAPPLRAAFAVVAAAAIVAIAIPLASTSLLRQSEADARDGDLGAALENARSAENVLPGSAAPRLQQALVLEEAGDLPAAAEAARAATERESTNWRNWLVLSRVEAERGRTAAAVSAYRRAESLNPRFPLFSD
jgi:O-antigen ligase